MPSIVNLGADEPLPEHSGSNFVDLSRHVHAELAASGNLPRYDDAQRKGEVRMPPGVWEARRSHASMRVRGNGSKNAYLLM